MGWRRFLDNAIGILIVIAMLGIALFLGTTARPILLKVNNGFGPDWDCTYPGRGDPICFKHLHKQPGAE